MPDIAEKFWTEADDKNTEQQPNGFPGNMPAQIDTTGRMVMGAVKRSWRRANPYYLTSGTGDDYIVTPELSPTRLNQYEVIRLRIDRANTTTTPTLKFGRAPAYVITKVQSTGQVALAIGDLVAGTDHEFWFDGTNFICSNAAVSEGAAHALEVAEAALVAANDAGIAAAAAGETADEALALAETALQPGDARLPDAFATLAELNASTVKPGISKVFLRERVAGKGGGAWWDVVGVTQPDVPASVRTQDASGTWLQLSWSLNADITPEMCGAFGGFVIESETRTIFNAMTGTIYSEYLKLIDGYVQTLKRIKVWPLIGWMQVSGASKQHGKINFKVPGTGDLTEVSTASFTPGGGWVAGGGGSLDTGAYTFSNIAGYAQDNAHLMVFQSNRAAQDDSPIIGSDSTVAPSAYLIPRRASAATFRKRLNSSVATDTTVVDGYGMTMSVRVSSGFIRNFQNGVFLDEDTSTSTGLPVGNLKLLKVSASDSVGTVVLASAGSGMTDAQADAYHEVTRVFVNKLRGAITAGYPVTAAMLDDAIAINATTTTTAMKDFISFISFGRAKGRFNGVDYVVNDVLRPKYAVTMKGLRGKTRIRMDASVGRNIPVIQTGDTNDPAWDIYLSNFTVDFNFARLGVSGGTANSAASGSALTVVYTIKARIKGVDATDSYKHCFDATGATYNGSNVSGTVLPYDPQMSENVKFIDCHAEGAGDDCFTSHSCRYVWFIGCSARFAMANFAGTTSNSNGFEIDDFSDLVWVIRCIASYCFDGIEVKGHNDAAAAKNVTVSVFESYKCNNGIICRHEDFGGAAEPTSASSYNLTFHQIMIRHPITWLASTTRQAFRCYSYRGLTITNMTIRQEGAAADYYQTASANDGAVSFFNSGGDATISGLRIEGFSASVAAVNVSDTAKGAIIITGLLVTDGPLIAVKHRGTAITGARVTLRAYDLSATAGTTGIDSDESAKFNDDGTGFITGYTTPRSIAA